MPGGSVFRRGFSAGGAADRRFDLRGYWQSLTFSEQRAFGEAGLAVWLSILAGRAGQAGELPPAIAARWSYAAATLGARARAIIPDISLFPGGPDLRPLGISEPASR